MNKFRNLFRLESSMGFPAEFIPFCSFTSLLLLHLLQFLECLHSAAFWQLLEFLGEKVFEANKYGFGVCELFSACFCVMITESAFEINFLGFTLSGVYKNSRRWTWWNLKTCDPPGYFWKSLKGKEIYTHINIYSCHRKSLDRLLSLRHKPEEFSLAFVPFHWVEHIFLQIVQAYQIGVLASLDSWRHQHSHVFKRRGDIFLGQDGTGKTGKTSKTIKPNWMENFFYLL